MTIDYSQLPLGKQTGYCDQYNPSLLVAVPRSQTRDFWPGNRPLPFFGRDHWTGYEVSWLDTRGKPQVATLLLDYDALSENIVESKSLKLYLNSFNQTSLQHADELARLISHDLGTIVGSHVVVDIISSNDDKRLQIKHWPDTCIDELDLEISQYHVDASLLRSDNNRINEQILVSHLLRSNCPVTGQPDWASVRVQYRGPAISEESLLRYICSYRLHQGFHEQCIERMFCDIWQQCQPQWLAIEGRFTRRGGLDINPFRCSRPDMASSGQRQVRQ